jgi:hypothetical protein
VVNIVLLDDQCLEQAVQLEVSNAVIPTVVHGHIGVDCHGGVANDIESTADHVEGFSVAVIKSVVEPGVRDVIANRGLQVTNTAG